jgi:hypothetical protein
MNGQPPYNLNSPFGMPQQGDYANQQRLLFGQSQYLAPFGTGMQPMFPYGMPTDSQQVDNMMALQRQQQILNAAFNPSQTPFVAASSSNLLVTQGQFHQVPASSGQPTQPSISQQQQLYSPGIQFPIV